MTIDELEKLIKRAEDVLGLRISLSRDSSCKWSVVTSGPPSNRDIYLAGLSDCVEALKRWATPQKPDMLQVLVPIATAEFVAAFETHSISENGMHTRVLSSLCREALAPYQQPE